jgi:short-subunit dehydrogenase
VVNYQRSGEEHYLEQKMDEIRELDVSILVNNVGVDVLDNYHKLAEETIANLMKVNCFSVTHLTRIFLPRFLERQARKGVRSAIVNVASLAGTPPSTQG